MKINKNQNQIILKFLKYHHLKVHLLWSNQITKPQMEKLAKVKSNQMEINFE